MTANRRVTISLPAIIEWSMSEADRAAAVAEALVEVGLIATADQPQAVKVLRAACRADRNTAQVRLCGLGEPDSPRLTPLCQTDQTRPLVNRIVRYLVVARGSAAPPVIQDTQAQVDEYLADWAVTAGYRDYDEYLNGPSNGHDVEWFELVVHGPVAVHAQITIT